MDFAFSEEQEQLRGFAREFLADRYDDAALARIADSETGLDDGGWSKIAEMGWLDAELTFLDQAVLFEETGYRPLPAPFLSTVALAAPALDADSVKRIGEGGLRATLAWAEPDRPQALMDPVATEVTGGRLTGEKVIVPDGAAAGLFVVTAADGLYAVDAAGAAVTPLGAIDGTRRLARVRFDGAPARTLATGEDGRAVLGRIRDRAYAALALEAVGVAQRALDLLVAYAKEREQFGRPIGVYQAVSHQASNVYVLLQEARSLAYWAAWCVAEDDEMARQACLAAKALAGEAAVKACESAIQGHGGIGFTWEHVLHRYYKRAQWIAAFDGSARAQRAEIAAYLLD
jgi:alkylation response protein AidB-like acyl-CoA dehydrogenase